MSSFGLIKKYWAASNVTTSLINVDQESSWKSQMYEIIMLLLRGYDLIVQGHTLYYYCTAPARFNWNTKQSHFANLLQQNR